MIWQQFPILLKLLHLQSIDGNQVHSFLEESSPAIKSITLEVMGNAGIESIVNEGEYCRRQYRKETSKLCGGYGKV
jgi:hypothetical protein